MKREIVYPIIDYINYIAAKETTCTYEQAIQLGLPNVRNTLNDFNRFLLHNSIQPFNNSDSRQTRNLFGLRFTLYPSHNKIEFDRQYELTLYTDSIKKFKLPFGCSLSEALIYFIIIAPSAHERYTNSISNRIKYFVKYRTIRKYINTLVTKPLRTHKEYIDAERDRFDVCIINNNKYNIKCRFIDKCPNSFIFSYNELGCRMIKEIHLNQTRSLDLIYNSIDALLVV